MLSVTQAIVLCGGKGERMGQEFQDVQKCTLKINGVPLILQNVATITESGIKKIVLLTGHCHQQIEQCFVGTAFSKIVSFIFCGDPYKVPLSVLKIIAKAEGFITGPFVSIHGDILFDSSAIKDLVSVFTKSNSFMATCVATKKEPGLTHTRIQYDDNLIVRKAEAPEVSDGDVYMGIDAYTPEIFAYCKRPHLLHPRDLLQELLSEGKTIRAIPYVEDWFHLINPENLYTR